MMGGQLIIFIVPSLVKLLRKMHEVKLLHYF